MLGHKRRRWQEPGQPWIRRHSLSVFLGTLLIVQMVGYHFTVLPEWTSEQTAHNESTALWPAYWLHYASESLISLLADTYGAVLLILAAKYFYEEGSPESGDAG